jgi:phage major head subunit gpT-like protein
MQAGSAEKWILADLSRPLKPFIFQKRSDYEFNRLDDPNATESVFMRDQYAYGIRTRVAAGFGFWQMAYGSKATLDAANLRSAYTAMTKFADDEGRPLGIRPTHLIVGPTNQFAARDILLMEQIDGSTNTNRNLVQLIEAPLLD